MKIVIDIPEEEYKEVLKDTYSRTFFENKIFTAIANGTPIPTFATNGDVVKTLYPRTRDFATGLEHLGVEVRIGEFPSKLTMNVDSDWWNAQYQKGNKK